MSLILEALKKSEQQRRLGEAPTLGSPVLAARRRRSLLPLFAVLIVIALGTGWWLTRVPAPSPAPPLAAAAPATIAATPSAAPAPQADPVPPVRRAAHTPAAAPPRATEPSAPDAIGKALEIDARQVVLPTPAPGLASERPGAVAALPPASPLSGGPHNVAPPRAPKAASPAPAAAPASGHAAATTPVAATPVAPTAGPTAEPAAPPATAMAAPAAPAHAALPSVWDLPYATRKDLPSLNLTMHVYASDPDERFVVIEGERHIEGDDLGDGVVLHEIRADGIVLDFKGQRFVYPRDGR